MMINEPNQPSDLKQKTIKGIFWSYLSFIGGKGLTFVTTIILARLLLPEQFGIIGYCLIAIQYLDILNSAGINSSLIARRENLEEAANAAFVANILLGSISFGLTWVLAPSIAVFFKTEEIVPVLRVLGLSLPISGLGLVPDALLHRELRFRTILIPDISRNFMKGLISIILALFGMGVWSLVWGQIAGVFTGTVLAWLLAGWRPSWRFNPEATRAIASYGFHIVLVEIAGAFRNNVDYLLVGRILGAAALGYYTMSFRIPELLIRSLNNVIGNVSLPTLAITQSDHEKLHSFYFGYIRYLSVFVAPIAVGLSMTAALFIPLFLSDKWQPAVIPTTFISLALGISALGYVPGVLYKAVGRPEILNRLALIKIPLAVFILWYSTRWGINGVAMGQISISIISVSLDTLIANYLMHFRIQDLLKAVVPAVSAAFVMAIALFIINLFPLSGFLEFIIKILVGVLVYFGMLWLVARETVSNGIRMLQRTFLKIGRPASVEIVSND
ncbi:MAG: lipopolysaccharide biosynthesis protein [Anaerolineales bacterium]|nr:lipopolysaccharide biosynthesis protein [Anaerolineales bacterium]